MSTVWDASTYDSERRRLVPCFDEFYGSAAELVARGCPSAPRVLDLGAGTGILSAAIFDQVQAGHLTLLDASADMLQRAAVRLAPWRPEIAVRPLTSELPSGPFDAVVSALAIHHLSDGYGAPVPQPRPCQGRGHIRAIGEPQRRRTCPRF